ncbi:MAG: hypothetical protein IAF38_02795 [Bacteroidia bacterium]|nr:hypothetical protein [Bacteroidia bacterium]
MKKENVIVKFLNANSRIVIPLKAKETATYIVIPFFNLPMRLIYLFIAWIITSAVLTFYSSLLIKFIGAPNAGREFLVCGGQMLFQLMFLSFAKKNKKEIFEYLGNMMSISLGGAILLIPMLVIGKVFTAIDPLVFMLFFLFVAGLMLLEHLRRMKITGLPKWLSATWVLYRVLVLGLILIIK